MRNVGTGPMRIVRFTEIAPANLLASRSRGGAIETVMPTVQEIVATVRQEGDKALRDLTARLDGVQLAELQVSPAEIEAAYLQVDASFVQAVRTAIDHVRTFHQRQMPREEVVETAPGVRVWRVWRPIERVGLYVPGGRACYPSSVIMVALPAAIAGCQEVVLVTPPDRTGQVPAATLVAAAECGVGEIYRVGGAHAIAALAYGTETIRPVQKIIGPGNAYVTAAKLAVFPTVAIDGPAGPSELMVVADESANPSWIAADLLSDAEHGPDSPALLVTTSEALAVAVNRELEQQLATLPRRELAAESLHRFGLTVLVEDLSQAVEVVNRYGPEHLELMVHDPHMVLAAVRNAGSTFLGPYAANAAGDYATGTNHVLPTGGSAAAFGPLSVEAFGRLLQVQELDEAGLRTLAPTIATLARAEGLEGHARAVEIRLQGGLT
jgi:histidinol dehydrogenase